MVQDDSTVTVKDIEEFLLRLPAVENASVAVNDWGAIEAIHVVADCKRRPKQIVRDIESALMAKWNIALDRRKISIAVTGQSVKEIPSRLSYSALEVKTDIPSSASEITVALTARDDSSYVGRVTADATDAGIVLGVARATCLAVSEVTKPEARIFVEDVIFGEIGGYKVVNVLVIAITAKGKREVLVGSALVKKSAEDACVRATLDALNRRIHMLFG